LKVELNAYFIGTEAPDTGPKISGVGGGYSDTGACHCILFAANGDVVKDRAEGRVQEEFDKAKMAFAAGDKRKAAFYAGAMAHYLGDLSQFMHMMGKESHWGAEVRASTPLTRRRWSRRSRFRRAPATCWIRS